MRLNDNSAKSTTGLPRARLVVFFKFSYNKEGRQVALTKDLVLELTLPTFFMELKDLENLSFNYIKSRLKKRVLLKKYNTFKVGGFARYFFEANNKYEIIESVKFAQRNRMPFFILGEGSNVLFSDKGFPGLVIKTNNKRYEIKNNYLWAESGVLISILVEETGKKGLSGLEWAGGLPGTVGGAVFGNAGAFGKEIKDNILWVESLNKKNKIIKLSKKECDFSYRNSIFKKKQWIILSAMFKLKKGDKSKIQEIAVLHIKQRQERLPLNYPNAGSIFKNYDVKKVPQKILDNFKDVIKRDPFPVIPAAAIIARTPGLMGTIIGKAQISFKHPNFIINLGGAKTKDIKKLINLVKNKVKRKFKLDMEEEIRYIE